MAEGECGMSDLYDTDVLVWSERQAALLRRLAAGERVNDDPDWPNIIEEIESVGRSELNTVRSLLRQALVHRLKAVAWPHVRDVEHWLEEAAEFQAQARDSFSPSMRTRIDLEAICRLAVGQLPKTIDGQPPLPVPAACPFTLDTLLAPP